MLDLEMRVHTCQKCKRTPLLEIVSYPPVYSFGEPAEKSIVVVGQNPSRREYISGYLSQSPNIEERRASQLTYFERRNYSFFNELERFFGNEVKKEVKWIDSPWERVGYLDLVKCPTSPLNGLGQWSKLDRNLQLRIVSNCDSYLKDQLHLYKPKVIIPYGVDVCRWFADYLRIDFEEFEDKKSRLGENEVNLLFVPQRQGPHSKPEIMWIQNKIIKMLRNIID